MLDDTEPNTGADVTALVAAGVVLTSGGVGVRGPPSPAVDFPAAVLLAKLKPIFGGWSVDLEPKVKVPLGAPPPNILEFPVAAEPKLKPDVVACDAGVKLNGLAAAPDVTAVESFLTLKLNPSAPLRFSVSAPALASGRVLKSTALSLGAAALSDCVDVTVDCGVLHEKPA